MLAAGCTTPDAGGVTTRGTVPDGETVRVTTVLDGDSFRFDGAEVRMPGINAPERDECFGDRSRAETARLIESMEVVLVEGREDRDQFGRLLRFVYLPDGTFVNELLVEEGYALALTSDDPRVAGFRALEQAAFSAGVGMWAPDACGPPAPGRAVVTGVEANPPGPDEDDLNGEIVTIHNPGSEAADLAGWVLRDESSANRYVFPPGARLDPGNTLEVLSGCGTDTATVRFWCAATPVWNNGGDTAYLLDLSGNFVSRFAY